MTDAAFTVREREFRPAYLRLGVEEIERRAAEAVATLVSCRVCPRNCCVDRLHDRTAVCRVRPICDRGLPLSALRRGGLPSGLEGIWHHLLLLVQPAMCLLPE